MFLIKNVSFVHFFKKQAFKRLYFFIIKQAKKYTSVYCNKFQKGLMAAMKESKESN